MRCRKFRSVLRGNHSGGIIQRALDQRITRTIRILRFHVDDQLDLSAVPGRQGGKTNVIIYGSLSNGFILCIHPCDRIRSWTVIHIGIHRRRGNLQITLNIFIGDIAYGAILEFFYDALQYPRQNLPVAQNFLCQRIAGILPFTCAQITRQ